MTGSLMDLVLPQTLHLDTGMTQRPIRGRTLSKSQMKQEAMSTGQDNWYSLKNHTQEPSPWGDGQRETT